MPHWEEFAVLDINGNLPKQFRWEPEPVLFPAETCARQIFFGRNDGFIALPDGIVRKEGTFFTRGSAAYIHALTFCTGLKGVDRFDKEVSGQVRRAWLTYQENYPESHKNVLPYVEALLHDAKIVKATILEPHMRRTTVQNIAVEKANLAPTDTVLLVGGADTLTLDMLTALGHRKKLNPGKIIFTHPTLDRMHAIHRLLKDLPTYRQPEIPICLMPFHQAMEEVVSNVKAVFVAHPIVDEDDFKQNPSEDVSFALKANERLCAAWQARLTHAKAPGHLIHLKGNPHKRCETSGRWLELDESQSGFVSFRSITKERIRRIQMVKKVTLRAKEVIAAMAAGRVDVAGERIVKSIHVAKDDLQLSIRWARSSRGKDEAASLG